MIKRQRLSYVLWNQYKNLPVKQVYAWIYIKSLNNIIIVSKDNNKWQMPWWKPKTWEGYLQTLYREILEETSINLDTFSHKVPVCFWFYLIEEKKERYLQLRYFIELENLSINDLHPNEKELEDTIQYLQLVNIFELHIRIPWMKHNNEFKDFLTMLE